jgi:hypothetical protein
MFGFLLLAPGPNTLRANGVGVIATVTAIDPRTGIATLATDGGEVFTIAKDSLWKVGTRLECERVADRTPAQLQYCLLWQ